MATLTRGLRNNNPGNIVRTNPRTPWQGRVPDAQLTDERFEQFIAAKWGIRAIAATLIAYHDKDGIDTVRGLINRWAPPVENDTGAYVAHVAQVCGVDADAKLDVHSYDVLAPMTRAIIVQENGSNPFSDAAINEGLRLAGVVPMTPTPLSSTDAAKGAVAVGTVGAIAALAQPVAEAAATAQPLLDSFGHLPQVVALALIGAAVVGVLGWRLAKRHATGA